MPISKRLRFEVLRRDNFRCFYCGTRANEGKPLAIDHVTPRALGGTDDMANLVAACTDCNIGKTSTAPGAGLIAAVTEHTEVDSSAQILWTLVNENYRRVFGDEMPACQCPGYCGDPQCRLVHSAYMSGWIDRMEIEKTAESIATRSEADDGIALGSA